MHSQFVTLSVTILSFLSIACCSTINTKEGEYYGSEEIFNEVSITKFLNIPFIKKQNYFNEWANLKSPGNTCNIANNEEKCLHFDVVFVGERLYANKPLIVEFGSNPGRNLEDILHQESCSLYECKDIMIVLVKGQNNLSNLQIKHVVEWLNANQQSFGFDLNDVTAMANDVDSSIALYHNAAYFNKVVISNADAIQIPILEKLSAGIVLLGVSDAFCEVHSIARTKAVMQMMTRSDHVSIYQRESNLAAKEYALWIQFATSSDEVYFPAAKTHPGDEFSNILQHVFGVNTVTGYQAMRRSCDSIHHLNSPYIGPYDFEGPPVNIVTKSGPIRGRHVDRGEYQGKRLEGDSFFHVPYGKSERFEHSEFADPWTEELDARFALKYKECPQEIAVKFGTEDCLNLNIFVPGNLTDLKSENKLLPVMVFFHGGSWEKGTGAGLNIRDNHIYDGTILGNIGEVIVVSVSYRLGALGFMNDGIDNGVLEGNYGIRDMVLSLQWVQENIDDYAGNNSLVTIFGQSAGSTAVSLLGLSPMTEGLLQGVIAESGAAMSFFSYDPKPGLVTDAAIDFLGCRSSDSTLKIECLRLRDKFDFPGMQLGYSLEWRPTIDGVFLTDTPEKMFETRSQYFNLLTGFNSDDTFIIAASLAPAVATDANITMNDLMLAAELTTQYVAEYPEKQEYISSVSFHSSLHWIPGQPDTTQAEIIFNRVSTDFAFGAPTIESLNYHSQYANGKNSYMYLFNIKARYPRFFPEWVYNSHAFELAYVFGETLRPETDFIFEEDAKGLSVQMMTYWSNFAKSGNPNIPVTASIENVTWDQYNSTNKLYAVLDFNMTQANNMASDYRPYESALWNELVPLLLDQDEEDLSNCPMSNETVAVPAKIKESKWRDDFRRAVEEMEEEEVNTFAFSGDGIACDPAENLVRETRDGCIRGIQSNYSGTLMELYLGVPYAEPPINELRFMETQFITTSSLWNGTLNTKKYKASCPITLSMLDQSEDCLYLNVYRPQTTEEMLPVMVWFHSDIDQGSGNAKYDGSRIAAEGNVIVVTVNYRVGIFGFLSTGENGVNGNLGILDQALALYWVRRNIANFGGNRDSVTLFGDSDSSEIIGYHVSSIVSEGLFQKVIHQSGAGEMRRNMPTNDLEGAQQVVAFLNCSNDGSEAQVLSCLTAAKTDELISASIFSGYRAKVVMDGTFILDDPANTLSLNRISNYEFLIGVTSGEGSPSYTASREVFDRASFQQFTESEITPKGSFINNRRIKAIVDYEYLDIDYNAADIALQHHIAAFDMYGDRYFVAPSFHIANMSSKAGATTYIFELDSFIGTSDFPAWAGSPHGEIEHYIWFENTLDAIPSDAALATNLLRYYTNFARTGYPGFPWQNYTSGWWEYNILDRPNAITSVPYDRLKYMTLWNTIVPAVDFIISCDDLSLPLPLEITLDAGLVPNPPYPIIKGYVEKAEDGSLYDVFLGLPYADPPTRFQSSTPATVPFSRGEVQEFSLLKPYCIETSEGINGNRASEDCLYLDIWRPRDAEVGPIPFIPTLVWFCNGGQSVKGPHGKLDDDATCRVDGSLLALESGSIVVKVRYRTGVFGFAAGDDAITGNAGLTDALNAVDWVLNNIASFGGNRALGFTIGGHGFGATLALHVASRRSISKVIAQSGSLFSSWAYQPNPEVVLQSVATRVGCSDPDDIVNCLSSADSVALTIASSNVEIPFPFGLHVISSNPSSLYNWKLDELTVYNETLAITVKNNDFISLLIGMNTADGFDFTMDSYDEMRKIVWRRPLSNTFIDKLVQNDIFLGNTGYTRDKDLEKAIAYSYYAPNLHTSYDIRRQAVEFHTDEGFVRPMFQEIEAQTSFYNIWAYVYFRDVPVSRGRGVNAWQNNGATFGDDVESLFNSKSSLSSAMRRWWGFFIGLPGRPTPLFPNRWNSYSHRHTIMYMTEQSVQRILGYKENRQYLWTEYVPSQSAAIMEDTTTKGNVIATESPVECTTPEPPPEPTPCPLEIEPLGTGIGLSLTPEEADTTIEVLFGLALSFACIIVLLVGFIIYKKKKLMTKMLSASDNIEVNTFADSSHIDKL